MSAAWRAACFAAIASSCMASGPGIGDFVSPTDATSGLVETLASADPSRAEETIASLASLPCGSTCPAYACLGGRCLVAPNSAWMPDVAAKDSSPGMPGVTTNAGLPSLQMLADASQPIRTAPAPLDPALGGPPLPAGQPMAPSVQQAQAPQPQFAAFGAAPLMQPPHMQAVTPATYQHSPQFATPPSTFPGASGQGQAAAWAQNTAGIVGMPGVSPIGPQPSLPQPLVQGVQGMAAFPRGVMGAETYGIDSPAVNAPDRTQPQQFFQQPYQQARTPPTYQQLPSVQGQVAPWAQSVPAIVPLPGAALTAPQPGQSQPAVHGVQGMVAYPGIAAVPGASKDVNDVPGFLRKLDCEELRCLPPLATFMDVFRLLLVATVLGSMYACWNRVRAAKALVSKGRRPPEATEKTLPEGAWSPEGMPRQSGRLHTTSSSRSSKAPRPPSVGGRWRDEAAAAPSRPPVQAPAKWVDSVP